MRATRAPLSVKVGCPNPNFPLLKGRLSFFKEQITAKGKKKKKETLSRMCFITNI